MLNLQGVLNLQKILVSLRRRRSRGNSFAEIISVGFDSCSQDDIIREADSAESTGILGLDQEGFGGFLFDLSKYPLQILSRTECYITVGTGKYELNVPSHRQAVGQPTGVLMWDKLIAFLTIAFSIPLHLCMKRV